MRTLITNCFLFQWDAFSPLHWDDRVVKVVVALVVSLTWGETGFSDKRCQTEKNHFPAI